MRSSVLYSRQSLRIGLYDRSILPHILSKHRWVGMRAVPLIESAQHRCIRIAPIVKAAADQACLQSFWHSRMSPASDLLYSKFTSILCLGGQTTVPHPSAAFESDKWVCQMSLIQNIIS